MSVKVKDTDVQVSYLKLNDKVYAIKEIEGKGIDIEAEIREYYKARHDKHVASVNGVVADQMSQQWTLGLDKIRQYTDRNQVAITPDLFGKTVIYHGNTLWITRAVLYEPTEIYTTYSKAYDLLNGSSKLAPFGRHENLVLTIKPPCKIPLVVGYSASRHRLCTPFSRTIHTFHDTTICTGNATAEMFWNLNDERLGKEISKINLFSPATSAISHMGQEWDYHSFINADTLVDINRREDTAWTTTVQQ